MNLEKEIQLFEEWCDIFGLPTDKVYDEYTDSRTTTAFLAWYEVVNRKGYKMVPVEPTDYMKCCVRAFDPDIHDYENMDKCGWENLCEGIYKAMIGAVE